MKRLRQPWLWCILIGLIAVALIVAAYRLNWPGTGFQGKTVWDWLSLLIIPLALALVALFFNQVNTRTERQIALDKQQEDLLQAYLDRMSDLLLERGLRSQQPDREVRNVARVRTTSILTQLDTRRVGYVFAFLREAGLIDTPNPVISLKDADFSNVNWGGANLNLANFAGANLVDATLRDADLTKAQLNGVNLGGADLRDSTISGTDLSKANLSEANLSKAFFLGSSFFQAALNGANLRGACLIRTELNGANFNGASLRGASLREANLQGADFSATDLTRVDFTNANLSKTNFKNAKINKNQLTPEQIAEAVWD